MRDIVFRGKSKEDGEWVYGSLMSRFDCEAICFCEFFIADIYSFSRTTDENMPIQYVDFIEVDENTIGQYTGLKDENDKPIFEGDIIYDINDCIYQIGYDDGGFAMADTFKKPCWYGLNDREWGLCNTGCKIIGNIYDNPELLKGENNG